MDRAVLTNFVETLSSGPRLARSRRLAGVAVGTIALGLIMVGLTAAPAAAAGVTCQEYTQSGTVPAAIVTTPFAYTVAGELCATRDELQSGTTVQLLLHGATYNHTYWDFGTYPSGTYSYARDVAALGYPTFAIDRLGVGQSTHPLSTQVTEPATAYVVHEVVQGLRSGTFSGVRFGKVIEVGHSAGSQTTWREAIDYSDVDGVVITGMVHDLSAAGAAQFATALYPANQDPRFQGLGYDDGYVTSVIASPSVRGRMFYNAADADPAVIAADDSTIPSSTQTFATEVGKDVYSYWGEAPGGQALLYSTGSQAATQAIKVPVLIIMGSADGLFCGPDVFGGNFDCSSGAAITRQEAPNYSSQARLQACSVPGAGHDVSLHLNRWLQVADAVVWSNRYVGQSHSPGPTLWPLPSCG